MNFAASKLARTAVAISLLATLAACGGGDGGDEADPAAPDDAATEEAGEQQELTITASGDKKVTFELSSDTLEAAPVAVTYENSTSVKTFPLFVRFNEGATLDEFVSALAENDFGRIFKLVTIAGSAGDTVKAGESTTFDIEFPEGEYATLDPEAKGVEPAAFSVGPIETASDAEPEADFAVELGDFYIKVPEGITAGESTFVLTNAGEQSHEFILSTGKGKDEKEVGFAMAPAPGGASWVTFDLEPGEYTAVCYFPDTKSGKPHVKLGMRTTFTVE